MRIAAAAIEVRRKLILFLNIKEGREREGSNPIFPFNFFLISIPISIVYKSKRGFKRNIIDFPEAQLNENKIQHTNFLAKSHLKS